jgi:hypothetical protein
MKIESIRNELAVLVFSGVVCVAGIALCAIGIMIAGVPMICASIFVAGIINMEISCKRR